MDDFAMTMQPIDVVALIQTIFTGLAALLSAIAGGYAIIAASRAKRAETVSVANAKVIELVERNTNSMTTQIAALSHKAGIQEGTDREALAGKQTAEALARGQREGREAAGSAVLAGVASAKTPVPVADDRTATAVERSASADEEVAAATRRVAAAAENIKPPREKE